MIKLQFCIRAALPFSFGPGLPLILPHVPQYDLLMKKSLFWFALMLLNTYIGCIILKYLNKKLGNNEYNHSVNYWRILSRNYLIILRYNNPKVTNLFSTKMAKKPKIENIVKLQLGYCRYLCKCNR